MNAQINRLHTDVLFLTELRPYRNFRNTDSLEKASGYITEEFKRAGLITGEQKWTARGNEYKNIIASFNPGKKRRLIVGAHYDVDGYQQGADDNASAVAGLLETARLITENNPDLDYGIDFVAYCLEELPFFNTKEMGSFIHAQSLFVNKTDVIGMICYEMIGYFSDKPQSQRFPSPELAEKYPTTGNFIIIAGIDEHEDFNELVFRLMSDDSKIDVQAISFPDSGSPYAGMSDQMNYWKFGYKALMINDTSMFRNINYHQKTDTPDTLNFEKMTEVINSSYKAVTGMDRSDY